MSSSTRTRRRGAETVARALVDTSVLVEFGDIDASGLPREFAVSAVTLAELTAGTHATDDPVERGRRQLRLQWVEAMTDPIPVDVAVARAYGRLYAQLAARGRKVRGRRGFDMLVAATALAVGLPLYTRNPGDFAGLDDLVQIVPI